MVFIEPAQAVLITGVGVGKSSMAVEAGDLLEERGASYAVLDLDFLAWFHTGAEVKGTVHAMMLRNLSTVVSNYRDAGVRFFILAWAVRDRSGTASGLSCRCRSRSFG
jgi:adenylylsulfate kinase-like enzyme